MHRNCCFVFVLLVKNTFLAKFLKLLVLQVGPKPAQISNYIHENSTARLIYNDFYCRVQTSGVGKTLIFLLSEVGTILLT